MYKYATSGYENYGVFLKEFILNKYEEQIVIETVLPYTPAATAGLRKVSLFIKFYLNSSPVSTF